MGEVWAVLLAVPSCYPGPQRATANERGGGGRAAAPWVAAEPVQAKKEVPSGQVSWGKVPTKHHRALMNVHSPWEFCSHPSKRVPNSPIWHPPTHGFPPHSEENLGVTSAPFLGPTLSSTAIAESLLLQVDCSYFLFFISSPFLDSYSFHNVGSPAFSLSPLSPVLFSGWWVSYRRCWNVYKSLKIGEKNSLKALS